MKLFYSLFLLILSYGTLAKSYEGTLQCMASVITKDDDMRFLNIGDNIPYELSINLKTVSDTSNNKQITKTVTTDFFKGTVTIKIGFNYSKEIARNLGNLIFSSDLIFELEYQDTDFYGQENRRGYAWATYEIPAKDSIIRLGLVPIDTDLRWIQIGCHFYD
jgi:hypothetical protein